LGSSLVLLVVVLSFMSASSVVAAQGVTTATVTGIVSDSAAGTPVEGATIVALHVPSGTQYRAVARSSGAYTLPNVRVGGPYRITATFLGFEPRTSEDLFLNLGETRRVDSRLPRRAVQIAGQQITSTQERESERTGAATFVSPAQVIALPSIKRSTRDLTRIDPRSDGNFSFAGRNWLYNSISLDGSYFNNSFGLDDPAPGGQANAEPVPFDAVEQVQVSIAPFDVRGELRDRDRGRVGREDRVDAAEEVRLSEELDLELQTLGYGLDDEVRAARRRLEVGHEMHARLRGRGVGLGDAPLLHRLAEHRLDRRAGGFERTRVDVEENGLESRDRGEIGDAAAHRAGAEDRSLADHGGESIKGAIGAFTLNRSTAQQLRQTLFIASDRISRCVK
jgi:hypothetical protein